MRGISRGRVGERGWRRGRGLWRRITSYNVCYTKLLRDTNGKVGTITQALAGAAGTGVSSVTLIDGGAGYTAAPLVSFTGGTLIGDNEAEAVATFDRDTGVVIV